MSESEARLVLSLVELLAELRWPDATLNPYVPGGELRIAVTELHEEVAGFSDACVARGYVLARDPACLHGDGLEKYLEHWYFSEERPERAEELRQGAALMQEEREMILDRYWHSEDCIKDCPVYYLYQIPCGSAGGAGVSAYFVAEAHEDPRESSLEGVFGPFNDLDAVCNALFDDPLSPLQSARGISEFRILEAQEPFGEVLQRRGDEAAARAL